MDTPQNIKKRLRSVGSIKKITKAMELVAATKMRRAQEVAINSRPYAFAALDLLANLKLLETELPALLQQRKVKKVLFVLVASDKGLAGAFNSSLFRKFEKYLSRRSDEVEGTGSRIPDEIGASGQEQEEKVFVAVGEKSFQYLNKKGVTIAGKFVSVGDYTTVEQVGPITDFLVNGYLEKSWDRVVIFSMNFRSALKQEPMVRRVLPVNFDYIKESVKEILPETGKFAEMIKEQHINFVPGEKVATEYLIEPSPALVLEKLAKHLLFMQVYHLILEANASEHSARRMAMKTASDNASDLGDVLHLQYNKSRQSAVTTQIIEISSGAEALS